jgi:hypothetical protein
MGKKRLMNEAHHLCPSGSEIKNGGNIPPGPPLRSSGQSFWLQIRRPGLDSRHYQEKN